MPIIKTKRLTLRPITSADAPRFAVLCNDEIIARNTARIPHPYSLENAIAFTEQLEKAHRGKTEFVFAVCLDETIVACTGADITGPDSAEIGYWVGADHRRMGIASELATAITQFALQTLGAKIITAGHFVDNPVSGRVLEKVGFVKTGETTPLFSAGRNETAEAVRMVLDHDRFSPGEDVSIIGEI